MTGPAYTISVGSYMLGTVESRDVTAAEMFGAAIEISRRQRGRPVRLSVFDDAEARPCWATSMAFDEALAIGDALRQGARVGDPAHLAALRWLTAKACARRAVAHGRDWLDHAREDLYIALHWHGLARTAEAAP